MKQAASTSENDLSVILFAAGSTLIVDYEESCRAAGKTIRAIVRNVGGPSAALNQSALIDAGDADADLLGLPALIPLFTPANRKAAFDDLKGLLGGDAPVGAKLVDATSHVPASTPIGKGSYVNAGVSIGAAGSIGSWCVINRGSCLGHHVRLGDFASVGPGVVCAGEVEIGSGAMIGAGVVVLPKVRIGKNAVVAAGSVVRKDVPEGAMVAGNPARIMRRPVASKSSKAA